MYVPRPLEFTTYRAETPVEQLAREMLSLSKLNWNNTQFDGGEPITVRAARRVGDKPQMRRRRWQASAHVSVLHVVGRQNGMPSAAFPEQPQASPNRRNRSGEK